MNKTYKDFDKKHIGDSDIASLTLRTPNTVKALDFGADGSYYAYIVLGDAEIGAHYELVLTCSHWLKIYDDFGLTTELNADEIKIYQAGDFGCIIQLINK